MSYLNYLKEEEGKEIIDLDGKGFFSYTLNFETKEMFVPDVYILPEHRGTEVKRRIVDEIDRVGLESGMEVVTGYVSMMGGDGDRFLKKLMFYKRLGFTVSSIVNNMVIIIRKVGG